MESKLESNWIDGLQQILWNYEDYSIPSVQKRKHISLTLKGIFDFSTSVSEKSLGPLKELFVDNNLDHNSIWSQLRLQNRPLCRKLRKYTSLKRDIVKINNDENFQRAEEEEFIKEDDDNDIDMDIDEDAYEKSSASNNEIETDDDERNCSLLDYYLSRNARICFRLL
jgi:hypothetical protein